MDQVWMKLAAFYWLDPKWDGLGATHQALYTRLLGYTVAYRTAGFIPATAIALCGRGIRNRDRLVDDMVQAGLLVTTDSGLAFGQAWHKWNASRNTSAHQSPGGSAALVRAGEEKRREEREIHTSLSTNSSNGARTSADAQRLDALVGDLRLRWDDQQKRWEDE